MSRVSVLIPSRNERFLPETVNDLFAKASGDIEVVVVCDGYNPDPPLAWRNNLIVYCTQHVVGMRKAINAAASLSTGDYLMKSDGHCAFMPGWDEVLQADMEKNWVVIPRRYSLDPETWGIENNRKPPRDYHYLCYPDPYKGHDQGMHGMEWWERGKERSSFDIDDNMSFQGSCWFMSRGWFFDFLHGLDEDPIYAGWAQEPAEIGNKTWLGGGEVKINKKCWYAHLHKGKRFGRMYNMDHEGVIRGHNYAAYFWMNNLWKDRIHDIDWLIDKFSPVPTWPDDWRDRNYMGGVYKWA